MFFCSKIFWLKKRIYFFGISLFLLFQKISINFVFNKKKLFFTEFYIYWILGHFPDWVIKRGHIRKQKKIRFLCPDGYKKNLAVGKSTPHSEALCHQCISCNWPVPALATVRGPPGNWDLAFIINKQAQAAGADPSQWSSTSRRNLPIQQNRRNF